MTHKGLEGFMVNLELYLFFAPCLFLMTVVLNFLLPQPLNPQIRSNCLYSQNFSTPRLLAAWKSLGLGI